MKPMVQPDSRVADQKKFAIRRCEDRWATKALVCSVLGLLSLTFGMILSALNLVRHQQWTALTGVGSLFVTFACVVGIAHLLDKESEEIRELREYDVSLRDHAERTKF